MATEAEHIDSANRTQQTIVHLLSDSKVHSPWIAITAFYKALHIVEAGFASDRSIRHTSNHGERESTLKRTRKFENVARNYLPLQRISENARYMSQTACFDDFMSPDNVVDDCLKHYLKQIEASVRKMLKNPDTLVGIDTAFVAR